MNKVFVGKCWPILVLFWHVVYIFSGILPIPRHNDEINHKNAKKEREKR